MCRWIWLALNLTLLTPLHAGADTACIDPGLLAHSVVSITRYFDEIERGTRPDLVGIQGTGWFRSPTALVTVEHVAVAMGLSMQDWKIIEIEDDADIQSVFARIRQVAGGRSEKLAVLELQTAISAARIVAIRMSPLVPEDRVVTIAYPNHRSRSVAGRFVQYGDGNLAGAALLELYEGNNRLVVDHGASGAPVFDCEGQVAAVISNVITQILRTPFGDRRVSTAWGLPNVVSVPAQHLIDFSKAQ